MREKQKENAYEMIQVAQNTGVRFFTSVDSGSYIPNHWHPAIEIIYMLEGELSVTVESFTKKIYVGQCILINPSVIHSTKCTTPNKAIVFQIPLDFISVYIPDVQDLIFTLEETPKNPVIQTKLDIF